MTTLHLHGLDCADEAAELRQTVGKLTGVRELSFDYLRDLMIVDNDESVASSSRLMEAVAAAGMRAEVWRDDALKMVAPTDDGRWRRSALTMASGVCLALASVCDWWTLGWRGAFGAGEFGQVLIASVLYVIAALLGSLIVLPKAWTAVIDQSDRVDKQCTQRSAIEMTTVRRFSEVFSKHIEMAVNALSLWRGERLEQSANNGGGKRFAGAGDNDGKYARRIVGGREELLLGAAIGFMQKATRHGVRGPPRWCKQVGAEECERGLAGTIGTGKGDRSVRGAAWCWGIDAQKCAANTGRNDVAVEGIDAGKILLQVD